MSYFISIHRYYQKRLVSKKSKMLFAIYVMVIGASVFSLGNSNGENYLGFLRIIRFRHRDMYVFKIRAYIYGVVFNTAYNDG